MAKSGGTYIPPHRLKQSLDSIDQKSIEFQRKSWEALRKSINGLINKVNTSNIREIVIELFGENIVRGRGLLVRAIMRAQTAALPFTAVYAALIAILNTKLPVIGELLLIRLVTQFRRSYRRNDKTNCLAITQFLAHLVNQRVTHEIVALQLATLLLERPTDDGVEIAVGFIRECGSSLLDLSPRPTAAIFERLRAILHECLIDKRIQYMIEVLFQLRKDGFRDFLAVRPELDLVDDVDQVTHFISLDDEDLDAQEGLNIFHEDEDFMENEIKYNEIRNEILGNSDEYAIKKTDGSEENHDQIDENQHSYLIKDTTATDLLNLQKAIYLTVMSSVDFEECGHKLLQLKIPEGHEIEICKMIVECCSHERTYLKFYGLLAERFCQLDVGIWVGGFELVFADTLKSIHRMETVKIRNVARLYAHLISTKALGLKIFENFLLTEEDTTSSSRIFLKFLLLDIAERVGISQMENLFALNNDNYSYLQGIFPQKKDLFKNEKNLQHVRFSINYFTAIGLGKLTDKMRSVLEVFDLRSQKNNIDDEYHYKNSDRQH